jgi:5-methylcytosine-specific restriction endonuclease McrA
VDAQPRLVAGPDEEPHSTGWVKSYDGKSYTRRVGTIRADVFRRDQHTWIVTLTPVAFRVGG